MFRTYKGKLRYSTQKYSGKSIYEGWHYSPSIEDEIPVRVINYYISKDGKYHVPYGD